MYKIEHTVFSHISLPLEEDIETFGSKFSGKKGDILNEARFASIAEVRRSNGYPVKSFNDLVRLVAELGYRNKSFNLLFRGQQVDYKNSKNMSTLYPSIFRPFPGKNNLLQPLLDKRFEEMNIAIQKLKSYRNKINIHKGLSSFREYQIALIQHYEVLPTPLLDLTHSLHVAASFALQKSKTGFVYVLGMPHTNGSISLYVDQAIRIVKLQNVCPPEALRPHFQNGYLIGRLPTTKRKEAGDNLAYRLIGKYQCDNSRGKFWGDGFDIIPDQLLMPMNDPFKKLLYEIIRD